MKLKPLSNLRQFLNYRFALHAEEPERILYLAIPLAAYETFKLLKKIAHRKIFLYFLTIFVIL
ncbi:element excision factor XisH family protein [Hydrocoleum sp. CS-953]|uniref:element excision factor XisH family protein n=1 Tax=Hydrocoleum sp. CS-953 TaxID=1671698 RepID=UPI00352B262A